MKTIILKGKVLSSFCIGNGAEWGSLDYFIKNHGNELVVVSQDWIFDAITQGFVGKDELLKAIKEGDFKNLHTLKNKITPLPQWIKKTIPIKKDAASHLSQVGGKSNQGIIKQHITNDGLDEAIIPGSTIKGMLRTAWLVWQFFKQKTDLKNLEQQNKNMQDLDQDLFKWISIADVEIENAKTSIQRFTGYGKPNKFTSGPKAGLGLNVASIDDGNFTIPIQIEDHAFSKTKEFFENFEEILREYSDTLIGREIQILDNIHNSSGFDEILDNHLEQNRFPIKIGMYKKSLTYRINWGEEINKLNNFKDKDWQIESRKRGIGDKVLYLNEDKIPVGWILLHVE